MDKIKISETLKEHLQYKFLNELSKEELIERYFLYFKEAEKEISKLWDYIIYGAIALMLLTFICIDTIIITSLI